MERKISRQEKRDEKDRKQTTIKKKRGKQHVNMTQVKDKKL